MALLFGGYVSVHSILVSGPRALSPLLTDSLRWHQLVILSHAQRLKNHAGGVVACNNYSFIYLMYKKFTLTCSLLKILEGYSLR